MSRPNFRTMKDFDIYLFDDSEMDEFDSLDFFKPLQDRIAEFNDNLQFHEISLFPGWYCGYQLFVEVDGEYDVSQWDNEDSRYYLGCYLSQAKRKFKAEKNKINKILKLLAKEYGFEKYHCVGIFSNGEAIYNKC